MKRAIGGSLLVVLGLASVPLSAQIDLAGEWANRFHEDSAGAYSRSGYRRLPGTSASLLPRACAPTAGTLRC